MTALFLRMKKRRRNEELERRQMKTSKLKMTELGPIPAEWSVVSLGDLFSFKNGYNTSAECYGAGTPVASVLEALDWMPVTNSRIRTKVIAPEGTRCAFSLKKGDLIFTRSSETLEDVGRSNVYVDDEPAMFGGFIIRGRPKTRNNSRFINFLLKDQKHHERVMSKGAGAQHYNIGQTGLAKVLITLPTLPEQEKIAEALSDVDALLSAMTTLIEKKRAIKQGAMQELLGMRNSENGMRNGGLRIRNVPRRRLAGFSGEWVEKRLGDCGSFSKGAGISRAQANSGRIPAVRYGELYTTHHEYIKTFESFISDDVARCSTKLTRGDIVFACSGETKEEIGKCSAFIGDEIAYAGGDLLILSPKEMYDSKFLAFELNTPFCASQKAAAGQGDAVVHIRQRSLEELIVRIPPTLAEQQAIAAVLSDMDAEIAALEAKRAKYESIKQGMMQELLTGRTRLKGE